MRRLLMMLLSLLLLQLLLGRRSQSVRSLRSELARDGGALVELGGRRAERRGRRWRRRMLR